MTLHSGLLRVATGGNGEIVDLTAGVRSVVRTAGADRGVATVFARGSTVAITTMEYEPGGIDDLRDTLGRLVPIRPPGGGAEYSHNRLNGDSNAHAHLRAAIVGPSESIPVADGELTLGRWQQVVLIDFDDRSRERTVVVHVVW